MALDEGRTNSGKTSSGRNPAFILYLYMTGVARALKKWSDQEVGVVIL